MNYEIQTLFGSRDYEEFHELISRGVLEILNQDSIFLKALETKGFKMDSRKFINPFKGKAIVLSISLELEKERNYEFEKFLFQKIIFSLKNNLTIFFLCETLKN